MTDGRIDEELLWMPPYDEIRKYTRLWRDTYRVYQSLRRYEQSQTLAEMVETRFIDELESMFGDRRDRIERTIEKLAEETLEWKVWANRVVGLGPLSFGKLLGYVGCPAARAYPSTFRKFCGYGVTNGVADRRTKGMRLTYNNLAKSQVFVIVTQFLKAYPRSPNIYGEFFYTWRQRYEQTKPEWTKAHRTLAAMRKVASLFLNHLWVISRQAHGLPVVKPYAHEKLGHTTYIPPEAAWHVKKCRDEVLHAIATSLASIELERDDDVSEFHQHLLERFYERVLGKERRKKAKR